jgi:shikimate kinase
MSDSKHIFLVGFMGAGKSTVGRLLARKMGLGFIDCDERIERTAGSTIAEIFACDGEEAFREMETAVLMGLRSAPRSVVACGGGIVLRESNRATLAEEGDVVYLKVTYEAVMQRVGNTSTRPLLGSTGAAALLEQRETLYEVVANHVVDTVGKSPADVTDEVFRLVKGEE